MKEPITVTQLNRYIKDMFSINNVLGNVIVKGEISNFKESHNNYYFSLKDDASTIQCIIFSNYIDNGVNLKGIGDGAQITVTGKVMVYEKAGTYAIYVREIQNTGLGEYFLKLEELKRKLNDLGMFDKLYKKEIPKYSINIGVVTALHGAAIKDIYKTIKNKNRYANVVLYPSKVQGDDAYETIVDGIMKLDKMGLDVIIIGRGGGSIEDLYCFNDERVAYAIFNANTPIISAVGHEINDSISDLVADLRVATPTAAGEAATFSYDEFLDDIESYREALCEMMQTKIDDAKDYIKTSKLKLDLFSPTSKIHNYKEKLAYNKTRINDLMNYKLLNVKSNVKKYIELLKARDALDKISKGFSYITNDSGKKIRSVNDTKVGAKILSRVKGGTIESKVEKIKKNLK